MKFGVLAAVFSLVVAGQAFAGDNKPTLAEQSAQEAAAKMAELEKKSCESTPDPKACFDAIAATKAKSTAIFTNPLDACKDKTGLAALSCARDILKKK